jgi:hypothetical protein
VRPSLRPFHAAKFRESIANKLFPRLNGYFCECGHSPLCMTYQHTSSGLAPRQTRYSQPAHGQTLLRTVMATLDQARGWGRTTATSVAAKSSPTHSTGCPVRSASAYVKQSPKFSPAG